MPARARPLSPHLQIYRWQISNTLSVLHRATGAALSLGLVALVAWLIAIAAGPAPYARVAALLAGPLGAAVLAGFAFAFFYHLLNGVRHLAWDVGRGFGRRQRRASGWLVVLGACLFTVLIIALVAHSGVDSHG
ncbi:MAG TPA: succinate dehydrogenase, cytochrome b556 subunit [Steroidobacteraceae bacterium]|nr:succinate dehydrogenase, cytochrome b556 subunit [Steroidobacteraceae bacterium]